MNKINMAAISDAWEAHRSELYEKIIKLDQVHIEKLVTALEEHHLIEQNVINVVEMSEQETAEAVLDSAGRMVTSDPTVLSNFLDTIKTFGMQPLADTIRGKVNLSESSMISGMLQYMPRGKGAPALSPLPAIPGSQLFLYMQNDHSIAASNSNTQSGDDKGGRTPSLPFVQAPGKSSLTAGTVNVGYPPINQASSLNSTSPYPEHLNQGRTHNPVDGTNLQGIPPNDSGIVLELSSSPGMETTDFGSALASPPVQRSHSGTSDSSSDTGLLEEASSPIRKKFQEMKVVKRKLKEENQELKEVNREQKEEIKELKETNLGLKLELQKKHEVDDLQKKQMMPVTETRQPMAGHLSLQYPIKGDMDPQDGTSNNVASHSENEQKLKSTISWSTFVSQEDVREIPHNTPAEVREYIRNLKRERKFLMENLAKTEADRDALVAERDALQAERDILLKWIQTIISHYERMIYDRKGRYKKICQQHKKLASEIKAMEEIASDSGMESLCSRKENIVPIALKTMILKEKAEEMNAEMIHIQELEQQRDEVVSALLQNHLPSSGLYLHMYLHV